MEQHRQLSLIAGILLEQIAPIFIVVGIGAAFGYFVKPDLRSLSRATFYILSPMLVLSSLTNSPLDNGSLLQIAAYAVLVVLCAGLIAWLAGRFSGLTRSQTVALMLVVMFTNSGNFGLSLNLFAFGEDGLAAAVPYYVTTTLMVFSVGVITASSGTRQDAGKIVRELVRLPAIYAVLASVLILTLGIRLPVTLQRPVDILGQGAIPVMLLILGIQLIRAEMPRASTWLGLAVGLRLAVIPLVGLGVAALLGLSGVSRQAVITQASMPTAVITTILAVEYDAEPGLVTGAVLLSTLLSPISLTIVLSMLQ